LKFEDLIPLKTGLEPEAGRLLIAEPIMQDRHFSRSVVYLTEHSLDGSMGFIVNHPASFTLSSIINHFHDIDLPIFWGGPVGLDTLHFLHSLPHEIGGEHIDKDIYWNGNLESIPELYELGKLDATNIRFFLGYSGWGAGQLASELDVHSWLISETELWELFLVEEQKMWEYAVEQLGERYKILTNIPKSPEWN
jgi:Putative transcriptional regulator